MSDVESPAKQFDSRAGHIFHPMLGNESRDMPGQVLADRGQELGNIAKLLLGVVVSGYDEGGDLEPYPRIPEELDVALHWLQPGPAHLAVELIIALQIYVIGVKKGHDLLRRLLTCVAVAHKDILQSLLFGQHRNVVGILEEYGRLCVGVGDCLAATGLGGGCHLLRRHELPRYSTGLSWHLGDIRILAVQAAEVAARGGYGIGQAAGHKMEEGLLLNGICVSSYEVSVNQGHQLSFLILPNAADSSLARAYAAELVAEAALHIAVQLLPELRLTSAFLAHE
ncbi:Uncharacterised protein [uncultured archaeon]|nr:Uncharacterised protein [uncultured archaeon]